KSYLVKMSEVKEISVASGSKYMAELKNGARIPIGRTRYKDVKGKWV
ncbi:LytTR family transcriptional regulator DNA-binding domain-containing protein, partial [Kordia sp.]